jgi:hypothetical protein
MMTTAHQTSSSAAAHLHPTASGPLELLEARRLRDQLKQLLRTEQAAMADFLIALADFDRRRGWVALGHANLFAFLLSELGLSPAPTWFRQEAARLLQRFPELERPLREGRLCLTSMGELAKVLTEENQAAVLPRFLGLSSREAKEVVAELQPRESPPMRTVVRPLVPSRSAEAELPLLAMPQSSAATIASAAQAAQAGLPQLAEAQNGARDTAQDTVKNTAQNTDPESLWAPKLQGAYPAPDEPRRSEPRRDDIDPLTAELSRLSTTVSRRFLAKLKAAREGLGHAIPRATTEQVLEAALDLLLEKQARARGQVKKPRASLPAATPSPSAGDAVGEGPQDAHRMASAARPEGRAMRRDGPRAAIPASVKRAVWARDGGRCTWPLDGGGCCGSTLRLELDHIVPWADWGGDQETNLRLTCAAHNRLAAQQAFGERVMGRYRGVREAVAEYATTPAAEPPRSSAARSAGGGSGSRRCSRPGRRPARTPQAPRRHRRLRRAACRSRAPQGR